jgi:hypothetical protein
MSGTVSGVSQDSRSAAAKKQRRARGSLGTKEPRLMSFTATRSFDRFHDLKSCVSPKRGLQVECRSRPERLEQTPRPSWRPRQPNKARGDCSVILSLQNNLVEAQTERCSGLVMLCQDVRVASARAVRARNGSSWHRGTASYSAISIFGGPTSKPGGRMLALAAFGGSSPLFPFALDTNANAKQEGSP